MRVWFNHWFSTAYYYISYLQSNGYYVVATNKRGTCVYRTVADEFYIEPDIEGSAYLKYCLTFCKEHNIDIFIPRQGISYIISNLNEFEKIGVKVLCERNKHLYNILNSKLDTSLLFSNLDIVSVPEHFVVRTANEFKYIYDYIQKKYGEVCIKYNSDEGGQSYKRISPHTPNINRIRENNGLIFDFDYVYECLSSVESFDPLVVMPYLNGDEVSVDCFGVGDKFIAVPRYKLSNRVTRLEQNDEIYNICKKFWQAVNIHAPFNVQFRYHNDELYILEVNTRLSGGAWKAKEVGVDFVSLALECLTADNIDKVEFPSKDFKPVNLSNLETVVVLDEV